MRFKNLLGLLAIGGAVAYAQKKRGGDLSLDGIKNSLRGAFDNVKNQLNNLSGQQNAASTRTDNIASSREMGSTVRPSVADDYGTSASSGYSPAGGFGGSNGIDRKY